MNTASIVYIFLGLFLVGGAYSFWKQKLPRGVVLLLALGAGMCLATGLMRL
ncbi:hypothetical protein [Streptacidiphilus sp. EB129]|uniref:hypothetical protein n=1 Tax=Streptacidiphilus sp. EB129 TaxID=3156262 RepID=UPI003513D236